MLSDDSRPSTFVVLMPVFVSEPKPFFRAKILLLVLRYFDPHQKVRRLICLNVTSIVRSSEHVLLCGAP